MVGRKSKFSTGSEGKFELSMELVGHGHMERRTEQKSDWYFWPFSRSLSAILGSKFIKI
jgi:hypothetical protein